MYCKTCGNEINDNAIICPKCGCPTKEATSTTNNTPVETKKINILCIIGFVLSLISLFLSLYGIVPIASLVLSIIGVVQAGKKDEKLKGLGIAGICVSVGSLIYTLFVVIILGAILML